MTGPITFADGDRIVTERSFPGPQGRLMVALLVAEHRRSVTSDHVADVLWGEDLPDSWMVSLRAIVSKVRRALTEVDPDPDEPMLRSAFGTYRLFLPQGTVVDLDTVRASTHDAETHLRDGRHQEAGAAALVSQVIAQRPFLPGVENAWVDGMRRHLTELRVRALLAQAGAALGLDDADEAIRSAATALDLDPYRERAVQVLIQGWMASGDSARAAYVYEEFRRRLEGELGVSPSPNTSQLVGRTTL